MKLLFIMTVLVLSAVVGCKSKEVKPDVKPPIIVIPPVDPPPPPVLPWYSQWDANQEFCKPEGKKFNCGNPVWYGLKGCKPDSDGDNHAEGTAYFSTLEEIEKLHKDNPNVTVRVKMKDGTMYQYGIGFAAPCNEM